MFNYLESPVYLPQTVLFKSELQTQFDITQVMKVLIIFEIKIFEHLDFPAKTRAHISGRESDFRFYRNSA